MRMVPLLTEAELITLMRDRHGVGFRIMNEAEAESCVRREGNWLRITSKIIIPVILLTALVEDG